VTLSISLLGYAVAAAAFGALTILLATRWRKRVRGSLLNLACLMTAVWSALLAAGSAPPGLTTSQIFVLEMVHDAIWLLLISHLLSGAVAKQKTWLVRRGGVVLSSVLVLIAVVANFGRSGSIIHELGGGLLVMGSIATSLYALVGIEQLYRNSRPAQQNGLKFLCLGLAAIFAYDLFMYSNAIVAQQVSEGQWAARGFIVALSVPLIAIAVYRIPSWSRGIFASRKIVFYTTTLVAAGIYLTVIGFAGYYIQTIGKEWSEVLSLVLISGAVIAFFILLLSDKLQARVRVWVVKHFFERKYDYRAEWLRLIHTLTNAEDTLPLRKRAILTLAQIVDSQSGILWLHDVDSANFSAAAGWNVSGQGDVVPADSALATFLDQRAWVIDIGELATNPSKYGSLLLDDLPALPFAAGLIIPLMHEEELLGFVVLSKPRTPMPLNFEDHDLLKTAGQQIASYLAQERATERLAESRQFEAYNRFTAFVMHDLKNAVAQQSLVVENAEKHKRNPEFIDDAIETIKGSVERMQRVIRHLRQSTVEYSVENIDLAQAVLHIESQCADREPVPITSVPKEEVRVRANRERLLSALNHAVRNAQEACDSGGEVRMDLTIDGTDCLLLIADTGIGMDASFVRDRLFRPFDSTKGAEGMGIGAYQFRETIMAAGGELEVESSVGHGTRLKVRLPLSSSNNGHST
jgi:putative PEP-CTERM system histidine kinase